MAASRAAVLGSPIGHSLSPVLHLAAYRSLGLTGWCYQAIDCDSQRLPGLLASLGEQWAGLSLTMPLKRAVLPLLDWAEPLVTDVGAANTVLLRDGRRLGYNTDVAGMVTALRQAGVAATGNVVVLGSGATACAALAALRGTGVADIAVVVRDSASSGPLLQVADRLGVHVRLIGYGPAVAASRWQLLLSTVPAGAAGRVAAELSSGQLAADAVFDVVYDPWPTSLAAAAASRGATVISGFELLVHQAAGQVELMTGAPAPVGAMRAAGLAELGRRQAQRSARPDGVP